MSAMGEPGDRAPATSPAPLDVHHQLSAHEAVLFLETDPEAGLTTEEAARRLARFGPNELPAAARSGVTRRLLRHA